MAPLELSRSWIVPGQPGDPYGIDQRLIERKEARLNGQSLVRQHVRKGG